MKQNQAVALALKEYPRSKLCYVFPKLAWKDAYGFARYVVKAQAVKP